MKIIGQIFTVVIFSHLISCQHSQNSVVSTEALPGLAIMQGSTDTSNTVLSIALPKNKKYTYSIHLDATVLQTPPAKEFAREDSDWKVQNLSLSGLTPGANYLLKIADEDGKIIDERSFKTFTKDMKNLSVAVVSCLDDSFAQIQKEQWQDVWLKFPQALFLIGDNVYVDTGELRKKRNTITDKEVWRRYLETRQTLEIYRMKNLIPVFATWDDHDYAFNNADSSYAHKKASQEIFDAFFPMDENSFVKRGPGVSSAVTLAKQVFVFFDDRSFRTASKATPDSHFGSEQEEWFFKIVKKSKGPFWLISGDQFFGSYHTFESFEGDHPNSFKNFLKKIKTSKKTVAFISGDRHIAEAMEIPKSYLGFKTYELTSSGLHAFMFPGSLDRLPNKLRVFAQDGMNNYLILKTQAKSPRELKINATFYSEKSKVLYDKNFEIRR